MAWAIWITGLPGSGKTSVALGVAARVRSEGRHVRILELDAIRRVVTPDPTYSEEERGVLYRALALMAALLVEAGVNVVVDATANRRAYRDLARCLIPRFAEVYLRCPLEVCRARERSRMGGNAPGHIYERADRCGAPVPGVGAPYEPPAAAELIVDTVTTSPDRCVEEIYVLVRRLEAPAAPSSTFAMAASGPGPADDE